jgi:hypothetical protein
MKMRCLRFIKGLPLYPASKIYGAHVGFSWAKREGTIWPVCSPCGPDMGKMVWDWSTGDHMEQLVWVLVIWGPDAVKKFDLADTTVEPPRQNSFTADTTVV